jgi:ATP-binding cassette subfamily B protein
LRKATKQKVSVSGSSSCRSISLASLVYTVLGIGASFYFKVMMDEILPNMLERSLHIISIGVIALYMFQTLIVAFRSHMLLYMSQKLDINLILGCYAHVFELPMSFFGTRKVGEIISRFQNAPKIRDAISGATLKLYIGRFLKMKF